MTIDVGTGDGRAVLAAAAREPATLALGLDASAAAMAEVSRRAAAPARKGGLENARFVVAAAEAPPPALVAAADRVTVLFPWGSLLRGVVGGDAAVTCGVAGLVKPGADLELLLAPAARDGLDGMPVSVDGLVAAAGKAFAEHEFELVAGRAATPAEVAASGSTWARRLGTARSNGTDGANARTVTLIRLARRQDSGR